MPRLFIAVLLASCIQVACNQAEEDTCTPRVERMREQVATAFEGMDAPPDVAPWAKQLYNDLRNVSDPFARATMISDGVVRSIGGCYGIAYAFREAADAPAGARRAAMARAVPEALRLCQCRGVDVESLSFMLRLSPSL